MKLVAIIFIVCWFTFFIAGIAAVLLSLWLSYKTREYWARKGIKAGLIWWNPKWHMIDDPEYNKVRNRVNKVNLILVIIIFLSGIVCFTIAYVADL